MDTHAVKHEPTAIDTRASSAGLRAVASFEAFKGVLVLLLLIALMAVHNRIEDYAEDLLYHLHIDFDREFAQSFLKAASRINDSRLWTVGSPPLSMPWFASLRRGDFGTGGFGPNGSRCYPAPFICHWKCSK